MKPPKEEREMSFGRDNHCTKQLTNGAKLSTATKQKRSDSFKTNLLAYTSVQPATLIKKISNPKRHGVVPFLTGSYYGHKIS